MHLPIWNRIGNSEISQCIHSQTNLAKCKEHTLGKGKLWRVSWKREIHIQEKKVDLDFIIHREGSPWYKELNLTLQTCWTRAEWGGKLHNIGHGNDFLDLTLSTETIKLGLGQWGNIKLKNFSTKGITKDKGNLQTRIKIPANYIADIQNT